LPWFRFWAIRQWFVLRFRELDIKILILLFIDSTSIPLFCRYNE